MRTGDFVALAILVVIYSLLWLFTKLKLEWYLFGYATLCIAVVYPLVVNDDASNPQLWFTFFGVALLTSLTYAVAQAAAVHKKRAPKP